MPLLLVSLFVCCLFVFQYKSSDRKDRFGMVSVCCLNLFVLLVDFVSFDYLIFFSLSWCESHQRVLCEKTRQYLKKLST